MNPHGSTDCACFKGVIFLISDYLPSCLINNLLFGVVGFRQKYYGSRLTLCRWRLVRSPNAVTSGGDSTLMLVFFKFVLPSNKLMRTRCESRELLK